MDTGHLYDTLSVTMSQCHNVTMSQCHNVTMDNGHLYNTLSVRQVRSKTLRTIHVQKPHELAQVIMSDTVMMMMAKTKAMMRL